MVFVFHTFRTFFCYFIEKRKFRIALSLFDLNVKMMSWRKKKIGLDHVLIILKYIMTYYFTIALFLLNFCTGFGIRKPSWSRWWFNRKDTRVVQPLPSINYLNTIGCTFKIGIGSTWFNFWLDLLISMNFYYHRRQEIGNFRQISQFVERLWRDFILQEFLKASPIEITCKYWTRDHHDRLEKIN